MAKKEKKKEKLPAETKKDIATKGYTLTDPFSTIRLMDRMFDDFRTSFEDLFFRPFTLLPDINRYMPTLTKYDFKLEDKDKEYSITSELPGVSKKDIDIEVTPESLEICVESTDDKEEGVHKHSSFCKCTTFTDEVIPEKAKATLKKGILKISIPKLHTKLDTKTHRITVK